MNPSKWKERSWRTVREVLEECERDGVTDPKERRKRLSAAYPFGERKYWPYKMWLQVLKMAMAGHTATPLPTRKPRIEESQDIPGQAVFFEVQP